MNKQPMRRYFRQIMQQRRGSNRRSYVTELENLQALIAWYTGEISRKQAEEFIDATNLPELWREAAEQGKELVR